MADAIEWFITTLGVGAFALVPLIIYIVITYPEKEKDSS